MAVEVNISAFEDDARFLDATPNRLPPTAAITITIAKSNSSQKLFFFFEGVPLTFLAPGLPSRSAGGKVGGGATSICPQSCVYREGL